MKVEYKLFDEEADFTLAPPCGLYCGNCAIFRAYFDRDHEKLKEIGKKFRCSPEAVRCSGCRTEPQFCWSEDCEFKKCTGERGIDFCYECEEFPCEKVEKFSESAPHHRPIWENFERMKTVGWREWLREQDEKWRCKVCRAKLGFYDEVCPTCGTPSQ